MIHSFSAADPADPQTIAGRWLAQGAFVYYGSVNEPYLQAFRPAGLVAEMVAADMPLAAALRQGEFEPFGRPWRLIYLGDPLYRLPSADVTTGPSPADAERPDRPSAPVNRDGVGRGTGHASLDIRSAPPTRLAEDHAILRRLAGRRGRRVGIESWLRLRGLRRSAPEVVPGCRDRRAGGEPSPGRPPPSARRLTPARPALGPETNPSRTARPEPASDLRRRVDRRPARVRGPG